MGEQLSNMKLLLSVFFVGTFVLLANSNDLDSNEYFFNSDFLSHSDMRYKKNIYPIEKSLDKISKIGGFYYDWKVKEYPKKKFSQRRQVGVIAQDVEKVLPEVVQTDSKGYKSVNYSKLTALLIEGVKELKKEVESQKKEINELNTTVNTLQNLLNENALLRKQIANLKEKVDPELKVNLHYDLEENNKDKEKANKEDKAEKANK